MIEKWKEERIKIINENKNYHLINESYLKMYLSYKKVEKQLMNKYSLIQSGNGTVVPDTFLVTNGSTNVFTIAVCPCPTFTIFPPVQYYMLYKDPKFHYGGTKSKISNAPILPASDIIDKLLPWLEKEELYDKIYVLREEAIFTQDEPFEIFTSIWEEKRTSIRFKDVAEFKGFKLIESHIGHKL